MTAPTPTCQNLVMRERDGVVGIWLCMGVSAQVVCSVPYTGLCYACTLAHVAEHWNEQRAQEHYAARRGKA